MGYQAIGFANKFYTLWTITDECKSLGNGRIYKVTHYCYIKNISMDKGTAITKYPNAIIVADDDVYRVFYSILTDNTVIEKMRNYLNTQKISYFEKDITVSDKGLITALNDYESVMKEASTKTFKSINDLILESYGEKI